MTGTGPTAVPGSGSTGRTALGRWRTGGDGRFIWVDLALWDLISLPLIPVGSLGWTDLVVPGTDLGFLARPPFESCPIVVGLIGGPRCWELSGVATGAEGAITGRAVEVEGPVPSSPPHVAEVGRSTHSRRPLQEPTGEAAPPLRRSMDPPRSGVRRKT